MEIEIDGLTKTYGAVRALEGVTLRIGPGMYGLLGPNGAGKTTLMRTVVTLLRPTRGTVRVGGFDVTRSPSAVRRLVGYLAQDFGAYRRLSAAEFLDYVGLLKGIYDRRERRRQVDEVLGTVGLAPKGRAKIGGFSGGMRRRLGIAQALLGRPPVLVVDEPTSGLDPEERVRFRNMLATLGKDRVVVLSTHIVADVEYACNSLALLDQGKLVFSGSPGELAAKAEGLVWEVSTNQEEYEQLRSRVRVVGARREQGSDGGGARPAGRGDGRGDLAVRVLARDAGELAALGYPSPEPVQPRIEDGYMIMVGGRRR